MSCRAFADEMTSSSNVASIQAEEGNLRYEYYLSFNDPETVLLIDSWVDQAAIDAHHAWRGHEGRFFHSIPHSIQPCSDP